MPDISITQVEYSNTLTGPIIHLFGRELSGVARRIDVTGFRPYFYSSVKSPPIRSLQTIPDLKDIKLSILGDPVYRIYTRKPSDVREVRERYKHYEADIPFTTRFLIDMHLTSGVSVTSDETEKTEGSDQITVPYTEIKPMQVNAPVRTCIVDIECDDSHGFPDPLRSAIICITCYDSFGKDYTTFVLTPDKNAVLANVPPGGLKGGCFDLSRHSICCYSDETKLLEDFARYITSRDPDVLSGWNFTDFDMPYITGRMNTLGIQTDSIARLPGNAERNALRGRSLFDLLSAYKKMHQQEKPSYRLDAIAFDEVGEQKVRYAGTLMDLLKHDPAKLIEYNFKDVELCVAIEKKNNIIDFFIEIARYVGMPLDKTLNSSSVVDTFILHKTHGKFVLPTRRSATAETKDFKGATVLTPVKGVHKNAVVVDLTSLYPMSMLTINASPETKDPEGELKTPIGIRFKKEPDGLVRSIITELFKERSEKKRLRNTFPFGSREYKMYDMQQNVIKVIMNTYYGVSGYQRFRLYDTDIGAAVTSVGRAILEFSRDIIVAEGYTVVLGDTDSCVFVMPDGMTREQIIAEAKRIEKLLNDRYKEFAKDTLNADVHYFSTKFEKMYGRFFSGGRKKRYAGLLTWKEGKDVEEVDVVGFEAKRSDTPKITRDVQTHVIAMILADSSFIDIRDYMYGIVKKYRKGQYSLDEIGIPGGFSKAFGEYKTDDAHMRGAKYANTYLGAAFGKASKPKRIYVKRVLAPYMPTDVLCFEYGDQVPPQFIPDYETMLAKTIENPITRIVEALGWSWNDFDPAHRTLASFGIT